MAEIGGALGQEVAAALPTQRTPPLLTITVLGQPRGRAQPRPTILKANPAKGRFADRAMVFADKETRSYQAVMDHCPTRLRTARARDRRLRYPGEFLAKGAACGAGWRTEATNKARRRKSGQADGFLQQNRMA
jgi:hypothetical protein